MGPSEGRVMVVVSKIDISEIQLKQLDAASIALIAKFAYVLKKHNGEVISLRNEHALRIVVYQAKMTDSAELKEIYARIKFALKARLNSKKGYTLTQPEPSSEQTDSRLIYNTI
jgi:hypothetical protein